MNNTDPAAPNQRVRDQLLRSSLLTFCEWAHRQINPDADFHRHWVTRAVHCQLSGLEAGQCPKLLLNVPYSFHVLCLCSVAFIAWAAARSPHKSFLVVFGEHDQADECFRQLKAVFEAEWFKSAFPGLRFRFDDDGTIWTNRGGRIQAANALQFLASCDPVDHISTIDVDKLAPDFLTEETSTTAIWCLEQLFPLLGAEQSGTVAILNQRAGYQDLIALLLESKAEDWEYVEIPQLTLEPQRILLNERNGGVYFDRPEDDFLDATPHLQEHDDEMSRLLRLVFFP